MAFWLSCLAFSGLLAGSQVNGFIFEGRGGDSLLAGFSTLHMQRKWLRCRVILRSVSGLR